MKKLFLYLLIVTPLLSACSENPSSEKDSKPDERVNIVSKTKEVTAEPKLIMTSFYPLYFMTEQIVGDKAQVINMAGNTDVHDYEPSPQDLVKLNKADLVVFQGAELEPWADGIIPGLQSKGVSVIEVTHDLDLAKMEEHDEHHDEHKEKSHHDDHKEHAHNDEHKHAEADHHEEHGEHKEHAAHDDDHHDEHNHGEFDPHTWLDPVLAMAMVDEITKAVISIDSANEAIYKTNANALKGRFSQLDEDYLTSLTKCTNDELILSHDAYGYLVRRYNFKAHTISGFSTNDLPSAKILAELKEEAEEG